MKICTLKCIYLMYKDLFRLLTMTQELGKVVALDGKLDFSKYPIGSTLKILPNHVSCMNEIQGHIM